MALRAGYKGIKKYIADMLNAMSPGDGIATDAEISAAISTVESVIGSVEGGDTASRAYAIGEHFIKDGKFCTVIQTIAAEATLTKDTNFVESSIGNFIIKTYKKTEIVIAAASASDTIDIPAITGYVPIFVTSSVSGTGASVNGYVVTAYDSITSMINGIKVVNKSSVEHTWGVVFNVMYLKSNTITVTSLDS